MQKPENILFLVLVSLFSFIVFSLVRFLIIYHGEAPLAGACLCCVVFGNFALYHRSKVVIWRMLLGLIIGFLGGLLFHTFMCYVHPISSDAFYTSLKATNNTAYQHPDILHEQYRTLYLWMPYALPLVPGHTDGGSIAEKCMCCILSGFFGAGLALTLVQLLYFLLGAMLNIFTLSPARIMEGAVDAMWSSLFEQHLTLMIIPGAVTGTLAGITSEFR